MPQQFDKEAILKKVRDRIKLSEEEEKFYLTEILHFDETNAERIISIADNTDKNVIID